MIQDTRNAIYVAIRDKRQIGITVSTGLGDVVKIPFNPYIIGTDNLMIEFVWGILALPQLFYKFNDANIIAAELTETTFEVTANACYQYSSGEMLVHIVNGFNNIYEDAARTKSE